MLNRVLNDDHATASVTIKHCIVVALEKQQQPASIIAEESKDVEKKSESEWIPKAITNPTMSITLRSKITLSWIMSMIASLMVGSQIRALISISDEKCNFPSVDPAIPMTKVASSSFQLAFDESFGYFDDISERDWKMYQWRARNASFHRYNFKPTKAWGRPQIWYYNNYDPIFTCPQVRRVSGIGDGPKWTCDPHRLSNVVARRKAAGEPYPHCLIYSIGSNGNYEWEDGIVKAIGTICEIHIFDFSQDYDRPKNKERNMHFHRLGLQGSSQRRGKKFATFPELLRRLGHEGKTIDILKIDCEGCEWDSYKDWIDYDVRQVLIETHKLPKNQTLGMSYFDSFAKNNLIMYSKEVNPWGGGDCLEFSYVKLHPNFLRPKN